MSSKKDNSMVKKALLEMEDIKNSIKENSKDTIKALLSEAVKDSLRKEVEEEPEYEVQGDEEENGAVSQEPETEAPAAQPEAETPADQDAAEAAAPEDTEAADGDAWAEFDGYKVGDDTYDLTGVEDQEQVVKVYKLLKDDDEVVVRKSDNQIKINDLENDAEYVIDLGTDEAPEAEAEVADVEGEEPQAEEELNEAIYEIDDDSMDSDADSLDEEESEDAEEELYENKKHTRRTMKESKKPEVIFEVDLGYTDNYQDEDPIAGLSSKETSKSGRSWDKGLPTGTEKPWAGPSKKEGEPFEVEVVNEEDSLADVATDEEQPVEENVTVTKSQKRHAVKTMATNSGEEANPQKSKKTSIAGEYKAELDEIKKENKELKEAISAVRKTLNEANIANLNLGKITRLFLENTTTQAEKVDIINRFSKEAKTKEQSNALYESISRELKKNVSTKNINENVNSAKPVVNESKTEKTKDLLQTIDLMNRVMSC